MLSTKNRQGPYNLPATAIPLLLIILIAAIAYSNSFNAAFTFDDYSNFAENPSIIKFKALSFTNLREAATQSVSAHRWLPNISFALNYYFNGYEVWGYHLVNLVIHILTAITMYYLFITTLKLSSLAGRLKHTREIALAAALLWVAHPLQTNAVTYIVQRMTSMATLFYLLSLLLYVRGRLQQKAVTKYSIYLFSLISGLAAMISKENSAMLLFMIPAYEFFFLHDSSKPLNKRKTLALLAAMIGAISILGWAYYDGDPITAILSEYELRDFSMTERLLTEPRVIFHYLSLIALPLPSRLNINYDYEISSSLLAPPQTILAIAGIIVLVLLIPYLYKRDRLVSFAILFFLANLAIESTVIPLEIIYEHRLYLPSSFLILATVALFYRLCRARVNYARTTALIATCLLTVFTWQRNTVWATEISLWSDVVKKSPNLARAYANLADAISNKSKGGNRKVEKLYLKTLELDPKNGAAYLNLGLEYIKQKRLKEAIRSLDTAMKSPASEPLNRHLAKVHSALGLAYYILNNYPKSVIETRMAIEYNPYFYNAYVYQGIALAKMGNSSEAENSFRKAIYINPKLGMAFFNLGALYFDQGRNQNAIASLKTSLNKKNMDQNVVHNLLSKIYTRIGRLQEAEVERNLAEQLQTNNN